MRVIVENTRRVGGFTLLEVLISIVIITIALFGVLLTQVTSIQGYTSARDYTRASEIAKVTTEMLHLEASTWRAIDPNLQSATTGWSGIPGADSPFDRSLSTIAGGGWSWAVMTNEPVDERLARDANLTGGRFCIFARGDYVRLDMTDLVDLADPDDSSSDVVSSPVFQVQVAVVYPGPTANPITDCSEDVDTDDLVSNDVDAIEALEVKGQRVAFYGTVISRRD